MHCNSLLKENISYLALTVTKEHPTTNYTHSVQYVALKVLINF